MDRRTFLGQTLAGATGLIAVPNLVAGSTIDRLPLQLEEGSGEVWAKEVADQVSDLISKGSKIRQGMSLSHTFKEIQYTDLPIHQQYYPSPPVFGGGKWFSCEDGKWIVESTKPLPFFLLKIISHHTRKEDIAQTFADYFIQAENTIYDNLLAQTEIRECTDKNKILYLGLGHRPKVGPYYDITTGQYNGFFCTYEAAFAIGIPKEQSTK